MRRPTCSFGFLGVLGISALLGAAGGARADEAAVAMSAPPVKRDRGEILLAIKAGGMVARPFNRLGGSYLVDVEVGYALPVLKHRLALTLDAGYAAPQASGSTTDPRITANGGVYSWNAEQRELTFGLTLIYRHPIGRVTPYVGVGPRLFLLQTRTTGAAGGTAVPLSTENATKIGAGVPLGVGFRLGPGDLFLEVQLAISALDNLTTGSTTTGSLGFLLGYRAVL